MAGLTLRILPGRYELFRLPADGPMPLPPAGTALFSVTRTDTGISVVAPTGLAPPEARAEPGWRALEVAGPLDLGQTGVLASLAGPLAGAEVALFAVSTFETDYLLVREEDLPRTEEVLRAAGHRVEAGAGRAAEEGC